MELGSRGSIRRTFSCTSLSWDHWFVRELAVDVSVSVSKYVYKVDILPSLDFTRRPNHI